MKRLKRLLGSVREFKRAAIITPILIIGEVAMECLIPFIISIFIDELNRLYNIQQNGGDVNILPTIFQYGGLLAAMAIVSLLFGAFAGKTCARASSGFARNLRHDMYAKIQTYSFENIDKFSTSSLVTRMTTDVNNVQMSFMMIIRTAVRAPLMMIFAIVMAFVMGGWLAAMFIVVVPLLVGGLLLIAKYAMPLFHRAFPKYDRLNESVEENVRGMRVVKSFVREEHEKEKFAKSAEDVRADFTKAERIIAWNSPLMQFCLYCDMIAVLLLGSYIVLKGIGYDGIGFGALSAMLTYGFQILSSLMMISMIYVMVTMSAESMKRICEVLDEESTITAPADPVLEVATGDVVFDDVSFKYSSRAERNALDHVNLTIRSGETVGVIGGTGSSKSTLVQLICRLYDVTEGRVLVGGHDVREYDPECLRNAVSVVLQKNELFSGTMRENLQWGKADATDEELDRVVQLAQAQSFVKTYDSRIEQGGANVSGGQKQRLCIARALLKSPKVLILDDSTSAVDTKTDALIRRGLRDYIPETTKIIIAQRIASVQEADKIVVMDGGKISAVGTHETLLRASDIYREVYESQNRKGGEEDA